MGSLLTAARLIFRETDHGDVGIDGYVELVDNTGEATGATIAVQVKSGASYLTDGGSFWKFYPEEKHRFYWEAFPLPVVLLLHDPGDNRVYWADVRRQLRSDQFEEAFLAVPKRNILSTDSRAALFQSCGTAGQGLLSVEDALKVLALNMNSNASFRLSYLDIFLEGLTDIGRKLFFSAGMCWDLAESRIAPDAPAGVGMGEPEERFLDGFLRFLVEQSLAHIDYTDVLIDVSDRSMFPTILVPLTSRGRAVRDLCRELGSRNSPDEVTEAPVGLSIGPHLHRRRTANLGVALKLIRTFLPEQS